MKKRSFIVYSIILLTLIFVSVCSAEEEASPIILGGPKMTFDVMEYDFGEIEQGTINKVSFNFKNTGDEALEIIEVKPSCGCTAAAPKKMFYMPGESGSIDVEFNSGKFKLNVAKKIHIKTNEKLHPDEAMEIMKKETEYFTFNKNLKPDVLKEHVLLLRAFIKVKNTDNVSMKDRELEMKKSAETKELEQKKEGEEIVK